MAGPVGAICCSASSLLAFRLLSSRTSKPTSPPLACYYVPEVRNLYGGTGYLPKIGSSYSHFTISSVANEINYTEQQHQLLFLCQRLPNPIRRNHNKNMNSVRFATTLLDSRRKRSSSGGRRLTVAASGEPLDLTEENVRRVLEEEARAELGQLFDTSVGITGVAELADLDGPFVKIRLRGKFWHQRSMVVARLSNFLKQRIPEVLEVEIEDEKQLDDSPASF